VELARARALESTADGGDAAAVAPAAAGGAAELREAARARAEASRREYREVAERLVAARIESADDATYNAGR
jgi:hypothetical protein